jgi:hypothetical protein
MTLLQWTAAWWRGVPRAAEGRTGIVPIRWPQPAVPARYLSLHTYLDRRYATTVVLTFEQVEALLGFALPDSARTEPDWWTAAAPHADWHSDAWTVAGRTATPNLPARTVTFERVS